MKCIKVVDKLGKFTSFSAAGKAEIWYKIGDLAVAPEWLADLGYHIFTFDCIKNAIKFAGADDPSTAFLECECFNEIELPENELDLYKLSDGVAKELVLGRHWPYGTRMYRSIRPIRVIPDTEIAKIANEMEEYGDN